VVSGLDNASNAYLRITFSGATAATGNNRLDNIRLVATDYTAPDTTPPVITVLGDNPLALPVWSIFNDPGATALDAVDGVIAVNTSGLVNIAVPGAYVITYSATDAANNTATATRTVNVVDVTAPVITVTGDNPLYLPVGANFVEPGATALDAIDGTVAVQTSGSVNTTARGTYTLIYSATDAASNTSTSTRTVVVRSGAAHVLATQYGLTGVDLAADTDNDGVADLMEYAFGKSPVSAADVPLAGEILFTGEGLSFSAVLRDGDNALAVTPLVSTNLQSWSETGLTEVQNVSQAGVPAGFRRHTWEGPSSDSSVFIRFEVSYE
jgi:hypothetical protein